MTPALPAALASGTTGPTLYLVHHASILALLSLGLMVLIPSTIFFFKNFKRLNSVVKAFSSVLLADWAMVAIFLPEAALALVRGKVEDGPWCKLLGWAALVQLTALLFSVVVVSHATWRLVNGTPLRDGPLFVGVVLSWVLSMVVASGFWSQQIIGPYKNLYCCVRDDAYVAWAVASTEIFVFGSAALAAYFYGRAWRRLREVEADVMLSSTVTTKASAIVLHRGVLLVSLLFFWWSLIIAVGFIRVAGYETAAVLDVAGALLVKCMPLFDGLFIWRMVAKVVARDVSPLIDRHAMAGKGSKGSKSSGRKSEPGGRRGSGSRPPGQLPPVPEVDVESGGGGQSTASAEKKQQQAKTGGRQAW